jgi:hypothetical protein
MRAFCLSLLLLTSLSTCRGEGRSLTVDGTFWQQMPDGAKVAFLIGYSRGYLSSSTDVGQPLIDHKLITTAILDLLVKDHNPNSLTYGTLEDGVDRCYSDFRNSKVGVDMCIDWVVMGVNGASDSVRADYLEVARRETAKVR